MVKMNTLLCKTEVSGRPKYELLDLGLLYLKDDQSKENAPDIGGPITIKDVAYKFGGWEQMNPDTGDTSLSVGLLVADDQPQSVAKEEESSPFLQMRIAIYRFSV